MIIRERHIVLSRINRDNRGGSLNAQENDARDLHPDLEIERATNTQLALRKLHLHVRRILRHDAHAIIQVQRTCRLAVRVGRNDKLEVLGAQLRRRHRACRAEGEHCTAADVQRDRGEVDVCKGDVLACAFDRRERYEVVELILGKVDRHRRCVLLCYGRDQDRVPEEELQVDPKCGSVRRILEPERIDHRRSIYACFMEGGIEVVE